MAAKGEEVGGLGEKGIKNYKLAVQKNHRHVNCSTSNIVDNIAITTYGAPWVLEISGGTLSQVYDCLSTELP